MIRNKLRDQTLKGVCEIKIDKIRRLMNEKTRCNSLLLIKHDD